MGVAWVDFWWGRSLDGCSHGVVGCWVGMGTEERVSASLGIYGLVEGSAETVLITRLVRWIWGLAYMGAGVYGGWRIWGLAYMGLSLSRGLDLMFNTQVAFLFLPFSCPLC